MTSSLVGLALLLTLPAASSAQGYSSATLQGFDSYRSAVITGSYLKERYGSVLPEYVALRTDGRASFGRRAQVLEAKILSELKGHGSLAYAEIYYGDYWTSKGRSAYVTFDLVDAADAVVRMPFKAAPKGSVADPEGLLAAWDKYQELGRSLQLSAQLGLERPSCPAFYCTYGSATPELAALERKFSSTVPGSVKALLGVLDNDASPERRSTAMFLLSYLTDGREVVGIALGALSDPDDGVRGAALQVLSDVTTYRKDVPVDPLKLYPVLDYPSTSDRSRALGVLVGLADNPAYEKVFRASPPPRILELLKMRQPVIHDTAYAFLVIMTKESYGRWDHAAWERWLADPPKPGKKKR
ncbi:MAG: HEAT repeat domain-containing protein [Elusimicrobia bacterium]|nr:HEAT repeat domain-containing protein [Elusimicrobiota bacterium]